MRQVRAHKLLNEVNRDNGVGIILKEVVKRPNWATISAKSIWENIYFCYNCDWPCEQLSAFDEIC